MLAEPGWEFEMRALCGGARIVAGIDEAGRGPLAGPVVAAAVILPESLRESSADWIAEVRDSKQVAEPLREQLYDRLQEAALAVGTGAASVSEIDSVGIVAATHRAMARAIEALDPQPDHLLIDAVRLDAVPIRQTSIVKGDTQSRSIAAASIIAKVTRDRLMREVLERRYPGYGFAGHKGYGSPAHLEALRTLGPCEAHRKSFAPVRQMLAGAG